MMRMLFATILIAVPGLSIAQSDEPAIEVFFDAASIDVETARAAQAELSEHWRDGYASVLVDLLDILQRTGFVDPRGFVRLARLTEFLSAQTGQPFGTSIARWRRWVWDNPYDPHADYGEFKGILYSSLDPAFADFFQPPVAASIRLDEIQWGGVGVNGIPPLDHPAVVSAGEATWLDDGDIVFGLATEGEARAYPKRILAWHELALDEVGGQQLTIVYCTLCGTVIPFLSEVGGRHRTFGTSGLLYRSNKLMFDDETKSLWSSLTGEPVVGPLVGSGFSLQSLPVVTTTWEEWRRRHPDTTVLSLETGFVRDYSEGAAYRAYFGTDALMFDVSERDGRLPNKAEVLVIRSVGDAYADPGEPAPPRAISADFLSERPVHHLTIADTALVVLTSPSGANRVYRTDGTTFERFDESDIVIDAEDRAWRVAETGLTLVSDPNTRLPRVSAHRAFWFGWYAQHPDTILIR